MNSIQQGGTRLVVRAVATARVMMKVQPYGFQVVKEIAVEKLEPGLQHLQVLPGGYSRKLQGDAHFTAEKSFYFLDVSRPEECNFMA
jgi:hypothetical protein